MGLDLGFNHHVRVPIARQVRVVEVRAAAGGRVRAQLHAEDGGGWVNLRATAAAAAVGGSAVPRSTADGPGSASGQQAQQLLLEPDASGYERSVFWCFCALVEDKLVDYYSVGLPGLQRDAKALMALLGQRLPQLSAAVAGAPGAAERFEFSCVYQVRCKSLPWHLCSHDCFASENVPDLRLGPDKTVAAEALRQLAAARG